MKLYLTAAAALGTCLTLALMIGSLLGLRGRSFAIFTALFGVLGVIAAILLVWYQLKSLRGKPKAAEGGGDAGGGDEVDVLLREAEVRLAAAKVSQGAGISSFPVIFLLGEPGSTKTSTMVHSGLEPELLAGQVYQETAIVPTRSLNVWYARQAIFLEPGGRWLSDPPSWLRLIRRLQPGKLKSVVGASGQAPRAAILCVDCDSFTRSGGADALTVMTRKLQARLGEISQALGISFPVYVLFTKADRLPFFPDFVRNLTNEEAGQVFGATLPLRNVHSGVYAESETQRIGAAFDGLFYSLCDKRLDLLPRETDGDKIPGAYEFPREFRKLRNTVVQFLVDLCRPSQLRASPFLRGFYFSGVRPVWVNEVAQAPVQTRREEQAFGTSSGATGIFKVAGQQSSQPSYAQQPVVGTKKVPQWVFITRLFNDLILQDRAALGASGASTRTSALQRGLLAAAAVLFLVFATGATVSFIGNRALENDAISAARGIPPGEVAGNELPSLESLQKLETLRQSLARLTAYERDGAPWRLRWLLYTGSDIYPSVRRVYYSRFRQLLFGQTQGRILASLQGLPAAPGPNDDYGTSYDNLKAYLISTSEYQRSTKDFLSPVLQNRWSEGRQVPPEILQLAQLQFDFYSEDLPLGNPYSREPDAPTVDRSRRYLAQFSGIERVYQFMLAEASRKNPKINFNARFPGSAEVVINNRDISGAFTKGGWDFMQDALKKADQFFGGERWVLGDYASANVDKAKLEQELTNRYVDDYIAQWRAFVKNSTVVRYRDLKDAAAKLTALSGNQTPLMALFWLTTQHTSVENDRIKAAFRSVHQVVPPPATDPQYVLPSNQNYMGALLNLQTSIEQVAGLPSPDPASASATMSSASQARIVTRQLAQTFPVDPEAQLQTTVQKLMEDPITNAEALLRGIGPAELNAKAKGLCAQFSAMTNKFPFNPNATAEATLQEVNALLRPGDGALWTFYQESLSKSLQKQGAEYVANPGGGLNLNPAFVAFFNQAAKFSEALYPNNAPEPKFSYSLQPLRSDQIQSLSLTIDGQTANFTGQAAPIRFTWPGAASREVRLSAKLQGGTDFEFQNREGLWSVFRFFADADQWSRSGAGYNLEWIVKQGREGRPVMIGGRALTYRFYLDTSGAPPVFQKEWLSGFRCVSQAAR
ncbi:MAG: ImcF-related family protein [Bryobacteraceae bacterium]